MKQKKISVNDDEQLVRLNFFDGALLSADDLKTEQEYYLKKQRRHNRYLHGWGVVSGFSVSMRDATIIVEPGMAIDCAGNEIFQRKQSKHVEVKGASTLYVVAEYCESKVDPVPQLLDSDYALGQKQVNTRIQETCRVYITDVNPISGHDGIGPGSYGCGHQHPVAIACLSNEPEGWRVITCGQR